MGITSNPSPQTSLAPNMPALVAFSVSVTFSPHPFGMIWFDSCVVVVCVVGPAWWPRGGEPGGALRDTLLNTCQLAEALVTY